MSLIRKMKRKYERDTRKKDIKDLFAHADRAVEIREQKLRKEYKEAAITEDAHNMTIAMYYLFGIQLHKLYGFGQQRCLRLFNAIDEELGHWRRGEISIEDLRQQMAKEIDIDIRFGDGE